MTIAMTSEHWGPIREQVPAARDARRQAVFRAARRHTALVRALRLAIPLTAVLAVATMIVAPFLNPARLVPGLSVAAVGISGGKVRMETPRLAGHRKDNRPYEVNAASALQDIRNPTQVELVALTARIQMEREGWVTVGAKTGLFDTQAERLRLVDDVRVVTETGYDIRMRTADIDFKAGSVVSREPVQVNLGETTVAADTLDVKDNGALISFSGRVRAVIERAPERTLAGPERTGSTPAPELLGAAPVPTARP